MSCTRSLPRALALALALPLAVSGSLAATPVLSQSFLAFGVNDSLRPIEKTSVTGPDGDGLWLGHKVSMYTLGGSWWVIDGGYVLVDLPNLRQYFPLTDDDIARYQRAGTLPTPLPAYALTPLDFIIGYSGWIAVIGALLWFGGRRIWRRVRQRSSSGR